MTADGGGEIAAGWGALRHWPGAELGAAIEGGTVNEIREVWRNGDRLVGRLTQREPLDLRWEAELLQALQANGLAVPDLIPTETGQLHADGLVLMAYVDGAPPETEEDAQRIGEYLQALHEITAGWTNQRPGWRSVPELVSADTSGPVDLTLIPDEVVALCRRAFERLPDQPRSVIHGDPNLTNVVVRDAEVILLDWDEARLDVPLLDLAARGPSVADVDARDRYLAEQAIHAWEACLFWVTSPDYAKRRLAQLDHVS